MLIITISIKYLGDACNLPPPPKPLVIPDPTMPPEIEKLVLFGERCASTELIVFVSAALCVFGGMRIFNSYRVIQMNMEISLILAHVFAVLLPNFSYDQEVVYLNIIYSPFLMLLTSEVAIKRTLII